MAKKTKQTVRTPVKLDPPKEVGKDIQVTYGNAPLLTVKFLEQTVLELRNIAAILKELNGLAKK